MRTNINKFISLITALLLGPSLMYAADNKAVESAQSGSSPETMLIALISIIVILLLVIGVAGFVLSQLAFVYRDKMRSEKSKGTIVKTILLLLAFSLPAFHSFAAEAVPAAANAVSTSIGGIPNDQFYILMGVIALEIIVIIGLLGVMKVLIRAISNEPELAKAEKVKKTSQFWDFFNQSVAIEKEKDVLLDHDYDGVQELDNILPPWWKYGFYLTIVVAIIYLYRYEIGHTAPNQQEEYAIEMQQAKEDKEAYLAKSANNIDENSATQLTDAASLAAGKAVFETICFACHLKDGGGSVGPNLTDDYWLHGGTFKDIFKTIKYGYPDKGMKSWKDDYSPKQIQQIASYVRSLHGTHPAVPKDKQGELFIEATTTTSKVADSTKVKDAPAVKK